MTITVRIVMSSIRSRLSGSNRRHESEPFEVDPCERYILKLT